MNTVEIIIVYARQLDAKEAVTNIKISSEVKIKK